MAPRSDKRERLINAAIELFYQQGFHQTTIADIAKLADVPLGNVYYYFKTKDEICAAVIKARDVEVESLLNNLSELNSSFARIRGLIDFYLSKADLVSNYGSIFSSLVQELSKHANPLTNEAKNILLSIIKWLEVQFEDFLPVGSKSLAPDYAMQLFGSIQGMQNLTLAFHDPKILATQAKSLTRWLASLNPEAAEKTSAAA